MNLIGKILVWVIVIMSVMFMGFTIAIYSTQHNWKELYDKERQQLGKLTQEKNQLTDDLANLKTESETRVAELSNQILELSTENVRLISENKDLKVQIVTLKGSESNLTEELALAQKNLNLAGEELKQLRSDLTALQQERHKYLNQFIEASDFAQTKSLELVTLRSDYEKLITNYTKAKQLLDALGYNDFDPDVYVSFKDNPPMVKGTITEIRPTGNVEISIGSDDGLMRGHKLYAYRNVDGVASYLGAIEIISTEPDKSVGKIIPELRNGTILRGDNVTSKIQ